MEWTAFQYAEPVQTFGISIASFVIHKASPESGKPSPWHCLRFLCLLVWIVLCWDAGCPVSQNSVSDENCLLQFRLIVDLKTSQQTFSEWTKASWSLHPAENEGPLKLLKKIKNKKITNWSWTLDRLPFYDGKSAPLLRCPQAKEGREGADSSETGRPRVDECPHLLTTFLVGFRQHCGKQGSFNTWSLGQALSVFQLGNPSQARPLVCLSTPGRLDAITNKSLLDAAVAHFFTVWVYESIAAFWELSWKKKTGLEKITALCETTGYCWNCVSL